MIATSIAIFCSGCTDTVPGDQQTLSEAEVADAVQRAGKGDREAYAQLAFHFSLSGDRQKAKYYSAKCMELHEPECLADEASGLMGKSLTPGQDEATRHALLIEAKRLTSLAIANAYPSRPENLEGYQFQARCIDEALRKPSVSGPDKDICPETSRSYRGG